MAPHGGTAAWVESFGAARADYTADVTVRLCSRLPCSAPFIFAPLLTVVLPPKGRKCRPAWTCAASGRSDYELACLQKRSLAMICVMKLRLAGNAIASSCTIEVSR